MNAIGAHSRNAGARKFWMLPVAKELKDCLVVDLLEREERHFVYILKDISWRSWT